MFVNKFSIFFILIVFTISDADVLEILFGTTSTTRKPTIFPKCYLNYSSLTSNYTEFGMEKKFFLSKKRESSWINAGSTCRRNGLKFATLDTADEQTRFINNLDNIDQKFLSTYIFIGGTTRKVENNYEWVWTETGEKIAYSLDWAPGQPNNLNAERCLGASKNTGRWKLHDVPCENFRGKFYCQK